MASTHGKQLTRTLLKATVAPLIEHLWVGKVAGLEHIPSGPAILVANHCSYMDFLVLGVVCEMLVRRPVHFWANHRITRLHPLFRHLAAVCEAVPVDRQTFSGESWRKSLQLLDQGRLLGIFPEGTRSRSGKLQTFRPGYLKLATTAGVPVIPVRLEGAYAAWPPQRRWPRLGRKCALTIHPPVAVPQDLSRQELEERNRMIVEEFFSHEAAKSAKIKGY